VPLRFAQAPLSSPDPGPRVWVLWISDVPGRQLRTRHGRKAHIELQRRLGDVIAGGRKKRLEKRVSQRLIAQPCDLEAEQRHVLSWVEAAQLRIKFETIDDAHGIGQAHVLGAQVPVPRHQALAAPRELSLDAPDEHELTLRHALDQSSR